MKRIVTILLVLALALSFYACGEKPAGSGDGGSTTTTDSTQGVTTTTTTKPLGDYDRALLALDAGKVGEAFRLLSASTDERAAELLLHFIWQKTRVEYSHQTTLYAYDDNGYLKTIDYGEEQKESYTWNADGTMQSVFVDYSGFWEKGTYTYENGLLHEYRRVDADGGYYIITYTYDDSGRLLVEDCDSSYGGDNYTTTFTYEENGRKTAKQKANVYGLWATATYSYDEAGRLIKAETIYEDGGASTITRTYNEAGCLITEEQTDAVNLYRTTYDETGRAVSKFFLRSDGSSDSSGTTTYSYDRFGRLTGSETITDSEISNNHSITYNDENDTCICIQPWLDAGEYIEYQLFYYPHAINQQLLETAGDWIQYTDSALQ